MRRSWRCILALALGAAGLAALARPSHAVPVYGTPIQALDFVNSRTVGAGLTLAAGSLSANQTIAWEITNIVGGFHYKYTITHLPSVPNPSPPPPNRSVNTLSHLILDLSDDCTPTNNCVFNANVSSTEFSDSFGLSPGNPGFPLGATIDGIKFETPNTTNTVVIEFDSQRVPVYGDVYMKAGSLGTSPGAWAAFNTGLPNHASENRIDFIARPDSVDVVVSIAEPGMLSLVGIALAVLLAGRDRRRRIQRV